MKRPKYLKMRRFVSHVFLMAAFLLEPGHLQRVHADVGIPPWSMPGSSVDPAGAATHVQMVSENVLVTIESHRRDDILPSDEGTLAANAMVGHVDATFIMHNQGDELEAFDVWFPLWLSDDAYHTPITQAENFAAWVDDAPAEVDYLEAELGFLTPDDQPTPLPWATWFVSFPPGRDVEIRVTYDIFPIGDRPYGTFHYILETGADWWGTIGEGTITFRLPYEVNESNTALNPDSRTYYAPTAPRPSYYAISGTDVVWHFADLEPTADDNVQLTVMVPEVWYEITAAQREAAANPDSAQAHLRLAHALVTGLEVLKITILPQANSAALADAARESFQRALALSPESVQVDDLVSCLKLLYWMGEYDASSAPKDLLDILEQALERNPDQVDSVIAYLNYLYYFWDMDNYSVEGVQHYAPPPSAALLSLLEKTLEIAPDKVRGLEKWKEILETGSFTVPTLLPTPYPISSPEPTAESAIVPTVTPAPIPTSRPTRLSPTLPPTMNPEQSSGSGNCLGVMATALVPPGLVWVLRRQIKRRGHRRPTGDSTQRDS
jgi:hypothetical protein